MTTKTKPSERQAFPAYHFRQWSLSNPTGTEKMTTRNYDTAYETISYSDGKRLPSGVWPWKQCTHQVTGYVSIPCGYAMDGRDATRQQQGQLGEVWYNIPTSTLPALPPDVWDPTVLGKLLDQVDLNTDNAVLLYSGVLQAVPLLGSVSTFLRTINKVVPRVLRQFRRQPFTQAIKSLTSLDFIDRFVISPTLDDIRKFQDATDYVLRVIQTARERNEHRFALESAVTTVFSDSVTTGSIGGLGGFGGISTTVRTRSFTTSKAFMLLEARYDMTAVDPIKVWAQRVGLTRPLDSVWDLVPFSFVIDYFTRAGDFITALSNEMSRVQGLTGSITRIYDLWGTLLRCTERTVEPTGSPPTSGILRGDRFVWIPGKGVQKNEVFRRFRVPDPWTALSSLSRGSLTDFLSVNLDLSATRKRTIAELVIQAKL